MGIQLEGEKKISGLANADDIILFSRTEHRLQALLNIVREWCYQWRMLVNISKTKIVHLRHKWKPVASTKFYLGGEIEVVKCYKYLGMVINESLDVEVGVSKNATAASHALGALIGKTKGNYDLSYKTHSELYHACVVLILDYSE